MTKRLRPLAAGILAGGAVIAYDVLAHHVSAGPGAAPWTILLSLLPATLLLLELLHRRLGLVAAVLGGVATIGAAALLWPLLRGNLTHLYLAQYLGTNLALGAYFGRSLLHGRTPVCTTFATVLRPVSSPLVRRYTRQVTVVWTAFFLSSASMSVLLYLFAPITVWSLFTNLLYLPSLALMFIVEGQVRRRVLPPEDRHGIVASVRAYFASTRTPPPPVPDPDLPPRMSR